jgi:two-component SAPR family response regulator
MLDPVENFIEPSSWPLKIFTFGRFSLIRDGTPVIFAGKVPKRPLELLMALIALGGRDVAEKQLSDHLWPNADWQEAHRAFTITLHRLRRLLGSGKFIELHEGRVTLDSGNCWVDVWAFERLAGKAEASLRKERQHEAVGTAIGVAQQAIALYRGDFLAGDADRPWAASRRERLRRRLLRLVAMVGRAYEEQGAWDKAADCYLRGLDASELAEELYQCLIHCYHRLGRHGEIASIYQRCHKALALRGIKPSSRTRAIYERAVHENRD